MNEMARKRFDLPNADRPADLDPGDAGDVQQLAAEVRELRHQLRSLVGRDGAAGILDNMGRKKALVEKVLRIMDRGDYMNALEEVVYAFDKMGQMDDAQAKG